MALFDPTGLKLPDFFLIGPRHTGVELLAQILGTHPDITLPGPVGGHQWFSNDNKWNRGLDKYSAKFSAAVDAGLTVGDASDTYFNPKSFFRLLHTMGTTGAKIIVMLQCPSHRYLTEQKVSGLTDQGFFDTRQQALADGQYHGLMQQLLNLFPFAQVYLAIRETVEADVALEVGKIITFLGKDPEKPFNALTFTKKFDDNAVRQTILNGFYTPGFTDFKTFLTGEGFTNTDAIDTWCPPPPTPPITVDDPSYAATESVTLNVSAAGVLTNDTDVNTADVLVVRAADVGTRTGSNSGAMTLNADGSFSFLQASAGVDTFTYHANDGTFSSVSPGTITVTTSA